MDLLKSLRGGCSSVYDSELSCSTELIKQLYAQNAVLHHSEGVAHVQHDARLRTGKATMCRSSAAVDGEQL